ncbi:membrane protein [Halomonas shantousis]
MTATAERTYRSGLNPLHSVLLAGTFPLFLGAALCDYAYASTYEIEWSIFASWLIAGGLVFNGLALLCALITLFRAAGHRRPALVYFAVLLVTWILGFVNALVHARDAWAAMPTGFVLSIVITVLAGAAAWLGFSRLGAGGQS